MRVYYSFLFRFDFSQEKVSEIVISNTKNEFRLYFENYRNVVIEGRKRYCYPNSIKWCFKVEYQIDLLNNSNYKLTLIYESYTIIPLLNIWTDGFGSYRLGLYEYNFLKK
jgi:hypothetical protein